MDLHQRNQKHHVKNHSVNSANEMSFLMAWSLWDTSGIIVAATEVDVLAF